MDYVKKLVELICGTSQTDGQIDTLIKKVMKEEYDCEYDARKDYLQNIEPTFQSTQEKDATSSLQSNNNPLYESNMIDRLNTPFDHIERILLQDLSGGRVMDIGGSGNYFKELFQFDFKDDAYGVTKIQINDGTSQYPFGNGNKPDYGCANNMFSSGEFFVDSFTYTPFVDYSTSSNQIGIYSDEFLNDYNSGKYNPGKDGNTQYDSNRHALSSELFTLGNLERDIYDQKIKFRNVIEETDQKLYVYEFCENLAEIFAKLSNIRMSHVFYGLKHPHRQWEGILALDIWYQLLYLEIDAQYPFDENRFDMNPMSRKEVFQDDDGEYVELDSVGKLYRDSMPEGIIWIPDDTVDSDDLHQYAFLWDESIWSEYSQKSQDITQERANCVTPRGVLKKIYGIVRGFDGKRDEITGTRDGDFFWFEQRGKVYLSDIECLSKYVNLHLGRAFDVMSPKEYCELTGKGKTDGKWEKPANPDTETMELMVEKGYDALQDAFDVMENEHVFNIFNSSTNVIELFDQSHVNYYSQAQCAIVVERVFSRLYKYLQFKSTTTEVFQRHINIDSGYKYLTTQSILNSDNPDGKFPYYSEDDEVPYLRYLNKVEEYTGENPTRNINLNADEKTVLEKFCGILSKKPAEWIRDNWDLCPLCKTISKSPKTLKKSDIPRLKAAFGDLLSRDVDDEDVSLEDDNQRNLSVVVHLNLMPYMDIDSSDLDVSGTGLSALFDSSGKPTGIKYETSTYFDLFSLDLSKISGSIVNNPRFTSEDGTITYQLLGFSDDPSASAPKYGVSQVVGGWSLFQDSGNVAALYAVWERKIIVKFRPGKIDVDGAMPSVLVSPGKNETIPECGYAPQGKYEKEKFFYHNNHGVWEDVEQLNASQEKVNLYEFDGWKYSINGVSTFVGKNQRVNISIDRTMTPVVTFVAQWKIAWNILDFMVLGNVFCEALVQSDNPVVPDPQPPTIVEDKKAFQSWDLIPGSVLPTVEGDSYSIVCDGDSPLPQGKRVVCSSDGAWPIICIDETIQTYQNVVNALVVEIASVTYGITFKYIDGDGENQIKSIEVSQDQVIPRFVLGIQPTLHGKKFKFRYWKLVEGDISSSMTVLSNSTLVAVYDEIKEPRGRDVPEDDPPTIQGIDDDRDDFSSNLSCPYLSEQNSALHSGIVDRQRKYCKYLWEPPKEETYQHDEVDCPYAKLLLSGVDLNHIDDDKVFDRMTLLEIDDISNLLKALFKVNIDIAHREYFLKVDIPEQSDWWYGYETSSSAEGGEVVCGEQDGTQMFVSFEPTVELKFSNFHAANQVENGKLICGLSGDHNQSNPTGMWITPVNRELLTDAQEKNNAIHYNDFWYYYDYHRSLENVWKVKSDGGDGIDLMEKELTDHQQYYTIQPLCLYQNTSVGSPVEVNGFIRHRWKKNTPIPRSTKQVKTFMSIVKKYRPIIVPNVRDIFDDCANDKTKYQVDVDNDYGVFGWCTIPSKTMVNMEYNEQSIIVPSSYDHHNRIGGNNFLQMDPDFNVIYQKWVGDKSTGTLTNNEGNTWYYLYAQRDWTYFMNPVFDMKRNSDLFSFMRDVYPTDKWPSTSNHINGVIFERSNQSRVDDRTFGDMVRTCQFLARRHHGENNLKILAERFTNLVDFNRLKELTVEGNGGYNSKYGSNPPDLPEDLKIPFQDWVDEYDQTSSNIERLGNGNFKYPYCLGQLHSIDDYDEDSVWFYITLVEPVENLEPVLEIEDIMPFVFWWDNRGRENNGPTAVAYGKSSSAKLNYEDGGWCYSGAHERAVLDVVVSGNSIKKFPRLDSEQSWHAVQHTIGVDFSEKEYGGTILTGDNSGNVYKGAFDPNCSATDEKWKIHHMSNAFGAPQGEDTVADKYYLGEKAHGESNFHNDMPTDMNRKVKESVSNRPMTWNLWNVVRHYVYIKYFKNRNRPLGDDMSAWQELENRTKKYVKNIYRTFQERKMSGDVRTTFGSDLGGSLSTNNGMTCSINWTNSFVEISSILEPNARIHDASFVLFTGDIRSRTNAFSEFSNKWRIVNPTWSSGISSAMQKILADNECRYTDILNSRDNFRIATTNGIDASDDDDGMRPRVFRGGKWNAADGTTGNRVYQGFKYGDMPISYVIGDNSTYKQRLSDIDITFPTMLDLDVEFPESEFYLNNQSRKWVRRILTTVMQRQIIPLYTSMESMGNKSHHDLTEEEMKSITFQVVPQFYWRYEWTFNDFMIHPVGKKKSPSDDIVMYDMLGNVWEWVRDDWTPNIRDLNKLNPIAKSGDPGFKVIKGGAFDQYIRKITSGTREKAEKTTCSSSDATQANIGFRPSMTYLVDGLGSGFQMGKSPVDLFFLFDASASQTNQTFKMIDSANQIIKKFAGEGYENRDICHVGSALFLGPRIRLMCCKNVDSDTQRMFVKLPRPDGQRVGGLCFSALTQEEQKQKNRTYADALAAAPWKPANEWDYPDDLSNHFKTWLKEKRAYYENITDPDPSSRDISSEMERKMDVDKFENLDLFQFDKMSSRDASGGSQGSGSEVNYSVATNPYRSFTYVYEKAFFNAGVGVWRTGDAVYLDGNNHLCTSDPRDEACSYYEFPFTYNDQTAHKGVLMNWWNGSEPSSFIVSKLLSDGVFNGFPYTPAIGYGFRNEKIPKLIFVYTNEFDNSVTRTESDNGENILVVPGVKNSSTLYMGPCGGQWLPFSKKAAREFEGGRWKKKGDNLRKVGPMCAPDPYCLSYRELAGVQYPTNAGLLSLDSAMYPFKVVPIDIGTKEKNTWGALNGGIRTSSVKLEALPSQVDLKRRTVTSTFGKNPFTPTGLRKILLDEQVDCIGSGNFGNAGVSYSADTGLVKNVAADFAMTQGFYELKNVVGKKTNPMNVYYFVGNGDAPRAIAPGYAYMANDEMFWTYFSTIDSKPVKQVMVQNSRMWSDLKTSDILKNTAFYTDSKTAKAAAKNVATVFGLESPYTSVKTIWCFRQNGAVIDFDDDYAGCDIYCFPVKTNIRKPKASEGIRLCSVFQWKTNQSNVRMTHKMGAVDCSNFFNCGDLAICHLNTRGKVVIDKWLLCDRFVSSESIKRDKTFYNVPTYGWNRNTYAYTDQRALEDCYTIEYKDNSGNITGVVKIICITTRKDLEYTESRWKRSENLYTSTNLARTDDRQIKRSPSGKTWEGMLYMLKGVNKKNEAVDKTAYPDFLKLVVKWLASDDKFNHDKEYPSRQFGAASSVPASVTAIYSWIQENLPRLMAARYNQYIFNRLKNGLGYSVTEYDNEDNPIIFQALPMYDFATCANVLEQQFNARTNFSATQSFQYSHCVIDLPTMKMDFANNIDVNAADTYKKSKIVMTRIGGISGNNQDQFRMGTSSQDYSLVTDETKIKYGEKNVILTQSTDNNAMVTLTNGGSFQKNDAFYQIADGPKKKKYKKNRHFFIDPFELTIAQWCYVMNWNNVNIRSTNPNTAKKAAIDYLYSVSPSQLNEMAKSYWKYLMVWEHDVFAQKKQNSSHSGETDEEYLAALYADADTMTGGTTYRTAAAYNPLQDTRPYYYATYENVRGTTQEYTTPAINVIDSSKGDEFQMNTRTGGTSFMDILNTGVKLNTRGRTYSQEADGGQKLTAETQDKGDYSGIQAGLNFDLPTEAQWEYCCRAGSSSAFPPNGNLGTNFDESDPDLDLIAWYKYKVIGKLPEPERFCTWRISKMLFGMTRDKEQVNNVYEKLPDLQ